MTSIDTMTDEELRRYREMILAKFRGGNIQRGSRLEVLTYDNTIFHYKDNEIFVVHNQDIPWSRRLGSLTILGYVADFKRDYILLSQCWEHKTNKERGKKIGIYYETIYSYIVL